MKVMRAFIVVGLLMAVARAAEPADHASLRLITSKGTITCRPDGTHPVERPLAAHGAPLTISPDGKHALFVRDGEIHLGDAEGKNATRVSREGLVDAGHASWSPDGRRIAFVSRHGDVFQAHVVDHDGGNARQLTSADANAAPIHAPHGVWQPRIGPDGRLALLVLHERKTKLQPADLLVVDLDKPAAAPARIANGTFITTHAWSPDGKTIAFSTLGSLTFREVATGKEQTIAYADIDPRLKSHAGFAFAWRPDGSAIACTIQFLGGRRAGGPEIFGDHEVFLIPRDGKTTWFTAGERVDGIEWITPTFE